MKANLYIFIQALLYIFKIAFLLLQEINYFGRKLVWKKNKLVELNKFLKKEINTVEIIQWIEQLIGVGFETNEGFFAICNGLDENEIVTRKHIDQDYKYINI